MLTPSTTVPSLTSINNPRQISFASSSATLVYMVPAGRKFVGYIYGGSAHAAYTITPSDGLAAGQRASSVQFANASTTPFQIMLTAGSIITNLLTNELCVIGVESDL